jgi:hypothetical protein
VAGVKGKSGGPNGGPQYNPMNISQNGSNGQMASDTQKAMYVPGLPQGQGEATFNTAKSAPLAGDPVAGVASSTRTAPQLPPVQGLNDLNPEGDPTDGLSFGSPIGPDAVPMPAMSVPQPEQSIQMVQAMYMMDPTNQDLRYILEVSANQGRI